MMLWLIILRESNATLFFFLIYSWILLPGLSYANQSDSDTHSIRVFPFSAWITVSDSVIKGIERNIAEFTGLVTDLKSSQSSAEIIQVN